MKLKEALGLVEEVRNCSLPWDDEHWEALGVVIDYVKNKSQNQNQWKSADGDDLPEIDREVIVLLNNGRVTFGHRPSEYFDSKDIITEKVTRNYIERYDKGLWNLPNIKYWLDCDLPKIKEE